MRQCICRRNLKNVSFHPLNEDSMCRHAAEQLGKCHRIQRLPECQSGGFEQQGTESPTKYDLSHRSSFSYITRERHSRVWKFSVSVMPSKMHQPPSPVGNGLPHGCKMDAAVPVIICRHDSVRWTRCFLLCIFKRRKPLFEAPHQTSPQFPLARG